MHPLFCAGWLVVDGIRHLRMVSLGEVSPYALAMGEAN